VESGLGVLWHIFYERRCKKGVVVAKKESELTFDFIEVKVVEIVGEA
jgi:hypothetical protein